MSFCNLVQTTGTQALRVQLTYEFPLLFCESHREALALSYIARSAIECTSTTRAVLRLILFHKSSVVETAPVVPSRRMPRKARRNTLHFLAVYP
jgi:hypothetical protein